MESTASSPLFEAHMQRQYLFTSSTCMKYGTVYNTQNSNTHVEHRIQPGRMHDRDNNQTYYAGNAKLSCVQ
jgi:hypothetical protein